MSAPGAIRRALVVSMAVLCAACGSGDSGAVDAARSHVRGSAEVGGDVVSTVDGHPITLGEVAHAAAGASVDPALALARLQDEAMLAQEAERAGWGDDADVDRAERRALVQALLARTVEVAEVEIDEEEIEAAYAESASRFDTPERRGSLYVLAHAGGANDGAAAQRWIAEVHAELAVAPDPAAAALAIRRRQLDALPFGVSVEEVANVDRAAQADPAYLEALFALPRPGVVPAPVRTSVGWHVIVFTDVEPARTIGRGQALSMLREERVAAVRAASLGQLIREIVIERPATVDPEATRLLANPSIAAEGDR